MISDHSKDRILEAAQIEDVVGHFVTLKKRGVSYEACCPFHEEKTPSFKVTPSKGIYKCFGCGKAGDAVSFVMEHEALNFPEALRWLADRYHITIEEETPESKERQVQKEKLYEALQFAQEYYAAYLVPVVTEPACPEPVERVENGHSTGTGAAAVEENEHRKAALERLLGLRYDKDIIENFGLGLSPAGKDIFTKKALKKGFDKEVLVKAGLTRDAGSRLYDIFQNRLMFPIYLPTGKIAGFGARRLTDKAQAGAAAAKYINSGESPVYDKSRVLYGLSHAKQAIRKAGFAFLVEGYTDVISFHRIGVDNTVASCGTSLTEQQLIRLKQYTSTVVICYDKDEAGQKNTEKAISLALAAGFSVRVAILEGDLDDKGGAQDPDSFTRCFAYESDAKAWLLNKDHQQSFLSFLVSRAKPDELSAEEGLFKCREILEQVVKVPDEALRSIYMKELAGEFDGIDQKLIEKEIRKLLPKEDTEKGYIEEEGAERKIKFWYNYMMKGRELTSINSRRYLLYLEGEGYHKIEASEGSYEIVRIQDNLVEQTPIEALNDHTRNYLQRLKEDKAEEAFIDTGKIQQKAFLMLLRKKELSLLRDTQDEGHIFFNNCYWHITADDITPKPYSTLDKQHLWRSQKINRDVELMPVEKFHDFDFYDFIWKIAGENAEKLASILSSLGYLAHGYKNPSVTKAVLAVDGRISFDGKKMGRTGKSLTFKSLRYVVPYAGIPGKGFDPKKNSFPYETIKLGTRVAHLIDVERRFDFEQLYNNLTEDMLVNKKNTRAFLIPFEDSPKFVLDTNFTLKNEGDSDDDRQHILEFAPYFSAERKPIHVYKHPFFSPQWSDTDWNFFYSVYAFAIQTYLQEGLIKFPLESYHVRQMYDDLGLPLVEFLEDVFAAEKLPVDKANKDELYEDFKKRNSPDYDKNFSKNQFTRKLKKYCEYKNYHYNRHADNDSKRDYQNGVDYVTIERK